MVVTVGIDVHKDTHCAVAVDAAGRQLDRDRTFRAIDAGHRQLLRWVLTEFGREVEFAVEDCRQFSNRLERSLPAAAQTVIRVPPKLMALTRQNTRTRGKSDPLDAVNIARAAVREPGVPRAEHPHASRDVKLLVDHREDLVGSGTAIQNRLRWLLHELDPRIDPEPRQLDSMRELDRVRDRVAALPVMTETATVIRIALEQFGDIRQLTVRARTGEGTGAARAAGSSAARPARLRRAHRGQAYRGDRQPVPVPLGGLLRDARRCRPDPSEQRTHSTPPPRPWREPAAERGPAPDRCHPGTVGLPRTGLLPASQD